MVADPFKDSRDRTARAGQRVGLDVARVVGVDETTHLVAVKPMTDTGDERTSTSQTVAAVTVDKRGDVSLPQVGDTVVMARFKNRKPIVLGAYYTQEGQIPAYDGDDHVFGNASDGYIRIKESGEININSENGEPVLINGQDVSAIGDTRTNVSDDGTEIIQNTDDINFGTDLLVSDDGDGSATVDFDTSVLYTDEQAQDAVGNILSSQFTYDDATPGINIDPHESTSDAHHARYTDSEAVTASTDYLLPRNFHTKTMTHPPSMSWDGSTLSADERVIWIPWGSGQGGHMNLVGSDTSSPWSISGIGTWNIVYFDLSDTLWTSNDREEIYPGDATVVNYTNYTPSYQHLILGVHNGDSGRFHLANGEVLEPNGPRAFNGHLTTTQTNAENGIYVNFTESTNIQRGISVDSSSQVSVDRAGTYKIDFNVFFHRTGSGARNSMYAEIELNGSNLTSRTRSNCYIRNDASGSRASVSGSTIIDLSAGDSIRIFAGEEGGAESGNDIERANVSIEQVG